MDKFGVLKADIDRELKNLERLTLELNTVLGTTSESTIVRSRAAGSVIHDFYTGVEKIFRRIAVRVDQDLPTGQDWHVQLLQRMNVPLEGFRPQVITESLARNLEEYLRFRHLFRNIYGFELRWERCEPLASRLDKTLADLKEQIGHFEDFLSSI